MASEAELAAVREFMSQRIMAAAEAAMKEAPDFRLALLSTPIVLSSLAGSTLLQLVRSRIVNDGELDAALCAMADAMGDHANPDLNPRTGKEVELSEEDRKFYRHGRISK